MTAVSSRVSSSSSKKSSVLELELSTRNPKKRKIAVVLMSLLSPKVTWPLVVHSKVNAGSTFKDGIIERDAEGVLEGAIEVGCIEGLDVVGAGEMGGIEVGSVDDSGEGAGEGGLVEKMEGPGLFAGCTAATVGAADMDIDVSSRNLMSIMSSSDRLFCFSMSFTMKKAWLLFIARFLEALARPKLRRP